MGFKPTFVSQHGTTLAQVGGAGTTPGANKVWTVFGMSLCNVSNDAVAVDLCLRRGGTDTYKLKGFQIPAGETHFPIGSLAKSVMAAGDAFFLRSSAAASIDAMLDVVESDA